MVRNESRLLRTFRVVPLLQVAIESVAIFAGKLVAGDNLDVDVHIALRGKE